MKQNICFDAKIDFPLGETAATLKARIVVRNTKAAAEITAYALPGKNVDSGYVGISATLPFPLIWKEPFQIQSERGKLLGEGIVLHPASPDPKDLKPAKRIALLDRLTGGRKDMLGVLIEEKGFQGLREEEIREFSGLEPDTFEPSARELEVEGVARILTFSPLFVLSQPGFEFLCGKILDFLAKYHVKHPDVRGVDQEKIVKRFELSEKVFQLALKHLVRAREIMILDDGVIALASFEVPLNDAEKKALEELEKVCFAGKFSTVSPEDIRKRFDISATMLQTLLSLLTEKKKIVQGKDGFYIHSAWLDDLVTRLRDSGKKDLSVADFKEMTGLTRKYAIPLLELLDEMGVTRRKGPGREILKTD